MNSSISVINYLREMFSTDLLEWWRSSELKTIYLIGSQTTGDANKSSDIDLLGIKNKISGNEDETRKSLKQLWAMKKTKIEKIGIRIRTLNEIEDFQNRMLLWGYTLEKSMYVYGVETRLEVKRHFPRYDLLDFLDCLIERIWCDNLFLARCGFCQELTFYIYKKSILDLIHFNFILSDNLYFSHSEKISALAAGNKEHIFPFDNEVLDMLKKSDSDKTQNNKLNDVRMAYLTSTWRKVLSDLKTSRNEIDVPYWGLVESNLIFYKETLKEMMDVKIEYRKFLLNVSLIIDRIRTGDENLSDIEIMASAINAYFNPSFKINGIDEIATYDNKNISKLLLNFEKVRHRTYPLAKRDWS